MLTYYRDRTVTVTSDALRIDGRVFPLHHLGDVWHRPADPVSRWHRTKAREIWAIWQGKERMLLRVSDETRFGQIYRAIQRAFEQNPG
jgi:hypothetical protein